MAGDTTVTCWSCKRHEHEVGKINEASDSKKIQDQVHGAASVGADTVLHSDRTSITHSDDVSPKGRKALSSGHHSNVTSCHSAGLQARTACTLAADAFLPPRLQSPSEIGCVASLSCCP